MGYGYKPIPAPAPAYIPAPAPAPAYVPAPAPAPAYKPAPAPAYKPAPAPVYKPAPAPVYKPKPAPVYHPAPSYPVQPAASVRKYSFSIVAPEPVEEARSAEGQVVDALFQEDVAAVQPAVEEVRTGEGRPVLAVEVPEVVEELLEEAESKINNIIPEAREEKK